ncbi:unnamed protein product [Urochloa humidicola]
MIPIPTRPLPERPLHKPSPPLAPTTAGDKDPPTQSVNPLSLQRQSSRIWQEIEYERATRQGIPGGKVERSRKPVNPLQRGGGGRRHRRSLGGERLADFGTKEACDEWLSDTYHILLLCSSRICNEHCISEGTTRVEGSSAYSSSSPRASAPKIATESSDLSCNG